MKKGVWGGLTTLGICFRALLGVERWEQDLVSKLETEQRKGSDGSTLSRGGWRGLLCACVTPGVSGRG